MSTQNRTKEKSLVGREFLLLCLVWSAALGTILLTWQTLVDRIVPEPYLDEVFHIPQALRYCVNNLDWDPKITTPPGIYLFTRLAHALGVPCTPLGLRGINAVLTMLLILPAGFLIRASSNSFAPGTVGNIPQAALKRRLATDLHAAVNVCLFPPLFTFTALYYTDVGSTGVVLLFIALLDGRASFVSEAGQNLIRASCALVGFWLALHGYWLAGIATIPLGLLFQTLVTIGSGLRSRPSSVCLERSMPWWLLVLLGLLALSFRQTNVFWVGAFPVGWRFLSHSLRRPIDESEGLLSSKPKRFEHWSRIINMTVEQASLLDYIRTAVSSAIALAFSLTMCAPNPRSAMPLMSKVFLPFTLLIGSFAAFVIWNGGVVLGDKSNHVATLHIPQMLYIWPYITFFSLPQMYPYILTTIAALLKQLNLKTWPLPGFLQPYRTLFPLRKRWHVAAAFASLICALAIIHLNTIVHPFTLADNRHYVFYVFRLLVLRHPATKYVAAPVYLFCGWLAIRTLGTPRMPRRPSTAEKAMPASEASTSTSGKETSSASPQQASNDSKIGDSADPAADQIETRTGFVLVWVATTALCLITAPLVEPRYYILPWILWRLQVPSPSSLSPANSEAKSKKADAKEGAVQSAGYLSLMFETDQRLWMETAWFLLINAVTGYLFLYRGFEWTQESGKVQRFIW